MIEWAPLDANINPSIKYHVRFPVFTVPEIKGVNISSTCFGINSLKRLVISFSEIEN